MWSFSIYDMFRQMFYIDLWFFFFFCLVVLFLIRSPNFNIIVSGDPVSYIILNSIISSHWFYFLHSSLQTIGFCIILFLCLFCFGCCSTLAQSTGYCFYLICDFDGSYRMWKTTRPSKVKVRKSLNTLISWDKPNKWYSVLRLIK